MGFTPEQIKGRIKSVAKQNNADARTLMRIYMMERFLERLKQSEYRDNFIIKGGILVTAMIGVAHRSTMDIDTSMKNLNLSAEDALRVVNQVKDIDLDDGVSFEVKDVSNIMDEMEYPGIRVTMNANVGRLITPLKIDISTGDVITPRAIEFNYDLLLEDRSISLYPCGRSCLFLLDTKTFWQACNQHYPRFGLGSREVARKRCIQVHSWRRKECCEICGRDHCSKQRRAEVFLGDLRKGDTFYP